MYTPNYGAQASAKQEMEAMGAAAKAMGVPQSRRVASRAGVSRAESKNEAMGKGRWRRSLIERWSERNHFNGVRRLF